MSSRLFNNVTTDYARFSGTPPVTAPPVTMLVAAQATLVTPAQIAFIVASSTTTNNWRLGFNSGGIGAFISQPGGTGATAASANSTAANVPFIVIGRERSTTDRDCVLNGVLASKGTNATSITVASLDRVSLGKRDSSSNDQPFNGVIFYAALWNAALSDEEVQALGTFAALPSMIRPASLMCYWPNLGRSNGTTIVDILGRCPLTLAGATADSDIAISRVMRPALLVGRAAGAPLVTGTGAATLNPLAGAATGVHGVAGTAAGTRNTLVGAASGTFTLAAVTGTGAATRNPLVGAATGTHVPHIGTGAATLNPLAGAAAGVHGVTGTGAATRNPLVGAASGTHVPHIGTGAATLNPLTGAAAGTFTPAAVTGTAAATLTPLAGAATGVHGVAGTAAGVRTPLAGAASGVHVPFIGTAAGVLNRLNGAAVGVHGVVGTAAGVRSPLIGLGLGTHGEAAVFGVAAGTLNPLAGAATGNHVPFIGTGAGVLNPLIGAAVGTHTAATVTGVGAGTVNPLIGAAVGTHTVSVLGVGAGVLPRLVGHAEGTFIVLAPGFAPTPLPAHAHYGVVPDGAAVLGPQGPPKWWVGMTDDEIYQIGRDRMTRVAGTPGPASPPITDAAITAAATAALGPRAPSARWWDGMTEEEIYQSGRRS